MKAIKIILGLLAVVVLLVGILIFFAFSKLDGFIKNAMESIGSEVLQTQVNIDDASFKLTKGRGEIDGITIRNPAGFSEPNFFTLDHIALQINPSSLAQDVYVIEELTVNGAYLTLEHDGAANTNLQTVLNNLKSDSDTPQKQSDSNKEPLFAVNQLNFINTKMQIVSPRFETREVRLKDIIQTGIGSPNQGLTSKQLAIEVVKPLLDEAKGKFQQELQQQAGAKIGDAIKKNLSEKDQQKLEQFKSLLNK